MYLFDYSIALQLKGSEDCSERFVRHEPGRRHAGSEANYLCNFIVKVVPLFITELI